MTSKSVRQLPVASTPKPPSLLGSSGFTPHTCTSWTPWRTSPPRATSPSTSCFEQARWSSLSAPTSSSPPSQCGAHPTRTQASPTIVALNQQCGPGSALSTPEDPPLRACSSEHPASIRTCLGRSLRQPSGCALLGTPSAGVALPLEHKLENPLRPSGGSAAGAPRRPSLTTSFPGVTCQSAVTALANLARLLQAPPVSNLSSRIRGARRQLPQKRNRAVRIT